jgi:hypothetical protein
MGNSMTDAFLIGKWKRDPSDLKSLEEYGETVLDFKPNGILVFAWLSNAEKEQIALLTYRFDGQCLITDQPSSPRNDKVRVEILSQNVLVLDRDGFRSSYVRA